MAAAVIIFTAAALALLPAGGHAQEWRRLLDLSGEWKLELGDNPSWADPATDDSHWDVVQVPSPWEEEGFPGYDGYAWYRKHFTVGTDLRKKVVYLHVGYVDDVSEVYLNGTMVGVAGKFLPEFLSASNVEEKFPIPSRLLRDDQDNVVAVRVFDIRLKGGIVRGRVGLYEPRDYLVPDYDLSGTWKLIAGDDPTWISPAMDEKDWKDATVPAAWETQGLRTHDGFGWYRLKFRVPAGLAAERLILLLGKVDDIDETYLNGQLIGKTGYMHEGMTRLELSTEWLQLRAYVIPPDLLNMSGDNVLAVRVHDVFMHGGIYDGPIGLVTREKYLAWTKEKSFWRRLFEWLW